jgi:N-acyl-phosphatidylethanolamine-hydrolysing phospholipase D
VAERTTASLSPNLNNVWNISRVQTQPQLYQTTIQRRTYIFLPDSLSESAQFLKGLFGTNHRKYRKHLSVKLQTRWQDALLSFRQRLQSLKSAQQEQRKLARQHAHAAIGNSIIINRSAKKYSSFVKNMQRKMGYISRGKNNIVSHYNAKKRIYTRRKLARQQHLAIADDDTTKGIASYKSIAAGGNTKWKGITLTEPAQNSWFDDEGYPKTSRDPITGRFVNPWSSERSNGENGLVNFLRWKFGGLFRTLDAVGIVDGDAHDKTNPADIQKINRNAAVAAAPFLQADKSIHKTIEGDTTNSNADDNNESEKIDLTWIGHSTTLINFPGNFTILTDPHFSNYAGPVRRNEPPSFGVDDLPNLVDCVLISHDHMDHLDYWSICELIDKSTVKFWVVPLGIKSWLMDKAGVPPEHIIELEWWEAVRLSKDSLSSSPEIEGLVRAFDTSSERASDELHRNISEKNSLMITCAPAQHWCSRTPFDRNRRLWCSYAVHATPASSENTGFPPHTHSFYFAGDTGLPPEFPLHHMIGDRLGPFDLAAIPIGAYEPNWFMRESHCNPAEAVKIHQAVRAKRSVAVHFDTFDLADEPREEPPKLLLDEVDRVNKEILNMAVEVVAVADEVGISAELEAVESGLASDVIVRSAEDSHATTEKLVKLLPPLVDFAVIKQGQSISSAATRIEQR